MLIGAPCHALQVIPVAFEDAQAAPRFLVPQAHGLVLGTQDDAPLIGAIGYAPKIGLYLISRRRSVYRIFCQRVTGLLTFLNPTLAFDFPL
jgi:hypothetical protein